MDHLAIAKIHAPDECALDVRTVAAALRVSPTTLYKYGFNRDINAAEQRQRENAFSTAAIIEQDYFKNQIRALNDELEKERERSKGLVGRIAIMEANAARLGIDPEEMLQPILKPVRTMSRAGRGGTHGSRKRSRTIGQ
jgi:benzoyl-CoA reductase/2-hydroxyglutaryl-CoA dehydratase subunit BcrC/BadD/HgdB